MILKIKRSSDGQSWWIIDGIQRISIAEVCVSDINVLTCGGPHDNICIMRDIPSKIESGATVKYIRIICRLIGGEELSIISNESIFVCSDTGKIIEEIVMV